MTYSLSQRLSHFFHVVSEIRPIVWICLYICAAPVFALIYWSLPEGQFRIPEGDATGYGSWLYYSIVTITTLGFGDYTPAHGAAQAVTAVEVMCGLVFLGLFLNAVGAMKSEIDVESEVEKQKRVHYSMERGKLDKSAPMILHSLNVFLAYCYAVTTPKNERREEEVKYNPEFRLNDLSDMFEASGLPFDRTKLPAVERLLISASQTSLALDSLQQRIDLTLWPDLLEYSFSFVANCQMFSNTDRMFRNPESILISEPAGNGESAQRILSDKIANWKPDNAGVLDPDMHCVAELESFIKENAVIASKIETALTRISSEK